MKTSKYLQRFFMLLFIGFALCAVQACDKDDDSDSLYGWYTVLSDVGKESDFDEIEKAIDNDEVLSSYKYGGETHEYVASKGLFIDSNGRYNDSDAYFGRLRFNVPNPINVIHILDEQTLVFYSGFLYKSGANKTEEALYTFYSGKFFGTMTYYGTPAYYTYVKVDNKLIVTNGDIYTITSSGLIKDGNTELWSKYDPNNNTGSNTGYINGHEYVDLGLSVKWATCNIGASSPEEYGDYFAWGDTSPTLICDKENSVTWGKKLSDISGNSQYDAARANWKGSWRMPTKKECIELIDKCTWTWTTMNEYKGYKVTGPNDNSIFLPAAGAIFVQGIRGGNCYYWSSTPDKSEKQRLAIALNDKFELSCERSIGMTIRPVTK